MPTDQAKEFDEFADDYDAALNKGISLSGESKDYFAAGRAAFLAGLLTNRAFKPKKILDFGCGTGSSTPYLLDLPGAEQLVGTDVSTKSVDRATHTFGSARATFEALDTFKPNGTFDLVFCNGVFHHIPLAERAGAMRFVVDSLRPGGLFALWENNPWNPGTRLVMSRIPFDRDAITLSPPTARKLVRSSGLSVVSTSYRFFFPGFLSAFRFMENALAGVPMGAQYQVLSQKS